MLGNVQRDVPEGIISLEAGNRYRMIVHSKLMLQRGVKRV